MQGSLFFSSLQEVSNYKLNSLYGIVININSDTKVVSFDEYWLDDEYDDHIDLTEEDPVETVADLLKHLAPYEGYNFYCGGGETTILINKSKKYVVIDNEPDESDYQPCRSVN